MGIPMEDPWSRVVCCKTNGYIVASTTKTDHVAYDWIDIVIDCTSGAPNYMEVVLKGKVEWAYKAAGKAAIYIPREDGTDAMEM